MGLEQLNGLSLVAKPPAKIKAFRDCHLDVIALAIFNINRLKLFPFDCCRWLVRDVVDYSGYLWDFVSYSGGDLF